ncbi:RraA family protein [Halomonas sp. N3-2A]|uniref:RraA family protein n=1 Tax=Halomonas sp. N3-2A TaxID=2014541 RepID=UPI001E4273BE|nr:RraA family protein [Halomonas sp. N3-2A]
MYHIAQMPTPIGPHISQQLLECETATIGHFRENGFIDPAIHSLLAQTRVVGTAVTLSLPPTDGTLLNHAMRLVRPGDILVIDRQGDDRHACWGGVMTHVAKKLGVGGVIIDGMATDAQTIQELGFPVWCRGISALTTKLAGVGGTMNMPVTLGGLVIYPGDIILADESGVLVVPAQEAVTIASKAIMLQQQEEAILQRVAQGECLPDISGATEIIERVNGIAP